jgi:hypothetical protein
MFSALVPQGHLKVSIERDRLLASYLVNHQRTACSEASRVALKGGRLRGGSTPWLPLYEEYQAFSARDEYPPQLPPGYPPDRTGDPCVMVLRRGGCGPLYP